MALFSLNMLEISVELALHNEVYADMARKFVQHFVSIASATVHAGGNIGMWDEEDGFFYDVLQLPNGQAQRLKVRSMVGLLPLCAVTVFRGELREKYPELMQAIHTVSRSAAGAGRLHPRSGQARACGPAAWRDPGRDQTPPRAGEDARRKRIPRRATASGRCRVTTPTTRTSSASVSQEYRVSYVPGESDTGMFGGNSNWRGPIWMPVNALIIRALLQYYTYYGNEFTVECPTGSGRHDEPVPGGGGNHAASGRHVPAATQDGRRPVNGGARKYQDDPHWRDCIQFYEYFHGDNGAGIGASHQTGWTGVIARAMHLFATLTPEQVLAGGARTSHRESQR